MNIGMAGRFRIEVRDGATNEMRRTLEFGNLILDAGLERIGTGGNQWQACQVGSSNLAPNIAQTGLGAYVAGVASANDGMNGPTPVAPNYVASIGRYFRFGVGVAAGNLSEVGIGWATTGSNLFSRALIVDEEGDPTTITVLPTEILDVYYWIDLYPPIVDSVFPITIGGIERECTLRWADALTWASGNYWSGYLGSSPGTGISYLATGAIGPITGNPTGQISSNATPTIKPYSSNSHYIEVDYTFPPGRSTGTIQAWFQRWGRFGDCQIQFDPPIAKTSDKNLVLTLRFGWGRHVP